MIARPFVYFPSRFNLAQSSQSGWPPVPLRLLCGGISLPGPHLVLSWWRFSFGSVEYHGSFLGIFGFLSLGVCGRILRNQFAVGKPLPIRILGGYAKSPTVFPSRELNRKICSSR